MCNIRLEYMIPCWNDSILLFHRCLFCYFYRPRNVFLGGVYRNSSVCSSVRSSIFLVSSSLLNRYWWNFIHVQPEDCMKIDNHGLKNIKGDNTRNYLCRTGVSFVNWLTVLVFTYYLGIKRIGRFCNCLKLLSNSSKILLFYPPKALFIIKHILEFMIKVYWYMK